MIAGAHEGGSCASLSPPPPPTASQPVLPPTPLSPHLRVVETVPDFVGAADVAVVMTRVAGIAAVDQHPIQLVPLGRTL